MAEKYLGQTDNNDGPGFGPMHGKIATPQGPCKYSIEPGGGASQKGGEPNGPFGQYMQSPSDLPIATRDSLSGAPQQGFGNLGGSQGKIQTPMDTSTAMPGVSGQSSGSGPVSGGGAKISSPFSSPFGDKVG